jgi:hypothetical protein
MVYLADAFATAILDGSIVFQRAVELVFRLRLNHPKFWNVKIEFRTRQATAFI